MMAELHGRVTGLEHDKLTGALAGVIVENQHGEVKVFKPDAWTDQEAFEGVIGKRVAVRVVVTVEP